MKRTYNIAALIARGAELRGSKTDDSTPLELRIELMWDKALRASQDKINAADAMYEKVQQLRAALKEERIAAGYKW